MLNKMLVLWMAIIAILLGISVYDGCNDEITDEDIMNEYVQERYGEECYGTLYEQDDDEDIEFVVYENGKARWSSSIDREYFTNKYND